MEGRAARAASKSATLPSTSLASNLRMPARTSAFGSAPAAAEAAMATTPPAASSPPARARLPPAPTSSARRPLQHGVGVEVRVLGEMGG